MSREEENDSLLKKKYLVISLDQERRKISSKTTSDLSNVNPGDYIHDKERMNICPVTITTTKQRAMKQSQKGKSSWMQSISQYFVLDKEQLIKMVIKEKFVINMPGKLVITIRRHDNDNFHNYVKQDGKVIENNKWELKRVEAYYFITWYDIRVDRSGKRKPGVNFISGRQYHSK